MWLDYLSLTWLLFSELIEEFQFWWHAHWKVREYFDETVPRKHWFNQFFADKIATLLLSLPCPSMAWQARKMIVTNPCSIIPEGNCSWVFKAYFIIPKLDLLTLGWLNFLSFCTLNVTVWNNLNVQYSVTLSHPHLVICLRLVAKLKDLLFIFIFILCNYDLVPLSKQYCVMLVKHKLPLHQLHSNNQVFNYGQIQRIV